MRFLDLIRKKRDGGELTRAEVGFVVESYTCNQVPDYQMAAWLMAVLLRGMTRAETAALTECMLHSGQVLDFSRLPGKKVDKHSTGGVGDKTSLVVAPVAAAGGLVVPMISGRGLGHTGGTLDKMEAIPGYRTNLTVAELHQVLAACGCAIMGQTDEIAPADRKIYALRDVTATVESQPLICASIMSKKLAEGINALVLDVKTGSGAFMKREEDSVSLAALMVETGQQMGKKVVAVISDMDQPLGRAVGHALEVEECIDVLRGGGPQDLRDLCLELAGWMFCLGEKAGAIESGRKLAAQMIAGGQALEKFRQMVRLHGGDPAVLDDSKRLPQARRQAQVPSSVAGCVHSIQCEQLGVASLLLGGGRETKDDVIDPAVGLIVHKKVGDAVEKDEPLCTVHYNAQARLSESLKLIAQSYRIHPGPPPQARPLVHRVIKGP